MTPFRRLTAALLASTCLAGAALAQAAPDITEIELGQAGIARYTLTALVEGPRISFTVPENAASDVLASLIVYDAAGGVVDLQTDTPGTTERSLRDTALRGGVPTSTADLLEVLRGETVELTTETGVTEGVVMGLGQTEIVREGERIARMTVLLLTGSGVAEIVLSPGTRVSLPAETAQVLADGLEAARTPRDMRRFDLTLTADTPRQVDLSYVTEAAAWKNSWRLLVDEGRLQGWATVENVSGTDWDDVALTLTTGSPVAYRRDLLDPLYIARNGAPDIAPAPIVAEADTGGVGLMSTFSGRALSQGVARRPAPPAPEMEAAPTQAGGILRYTLPQPIDLSDGRTANMLYLDMEVAPEIHALYRPNRSDQVLLAASIFSDQALAPGLISVQDAQGFVGDAPFLGMQAGETRLLPYAAAGGTRVEQDSQTATRILNAVYRNEMLTLALRQTRTTTYVSSTLPDDVDLFVVEHPSGFGRLTDHSGDAVRSQGALRITVPVEDATGTVTLTEEADTQRQVSLSLSELSQLVSQIRSGAMTADPALVEALEKMLEIGTSMEGFRDDQRVARKRYDELVEEQARLRENLESVRQETLRQRYLDALERTETQIGDVLDQIDAMEAKDKANEQAMRSLLQSL